MHRGILFLAAALCAAPAAAAERTLASYGSELTVRPGETIEFHVSSYSGRGYEADLVRLGGPGGPQSIAAPFAGTYDGVYQPLNLGSYLHVEDTRPLRLKSFSMTAYVRPGSPGNPRHGPAVLRRPRIGSETILSRYDKTTGRGWALQIDEERHVVFVAGDGGGTQHRVRIEEPVRIDAWARVRFRYDHKTGELVLEHRDVPTTPAERATVRDLRVESVIPELVQEGPLRAAAVRDGPGAAGARFEKPGDVFNGEIQDVRIMKQVLSDEKFDKVAREEVPKLMRDERVIDWDLGRRIGKASAQDIAPTRLHAEVVNLPARAIHGLFWDRHALDWREERDSYDAIRFSSDDLYDAEWKPAFSYAVPPELESGIYAARFTDVGFTDFVPFFVVPADSIAEADVALWMSDVTYVARSSSAPRLARESLELRARPPQERVAAGGVGERHRTGEPFWFRSRLRPNFGLHPASEGDFARDLSVARFLERIDVAYDVITDELVKEEGAALLARYAVVMTVTNPRFASPSAFDALSGYLDGGGRLIVTSGGGFEWSASFHPSLRGVVEARRSARPGEMRHLDGMRGGRLVDLGRSSPALLGLAPAWETNGLRITDEASSPRTAFLVKDVEDRSIGVDGASSSDPYDPTGTHGGRISLRAGSPRHAVVIARCRGEIMADTVGDPTPASPIGTGPGEVVFFETGNGGAVFAAGHTFWIVEAANDPDGPAGRMTRNALERFLDPSPFPLVPGDAVADPSRPSR